MQAAVVHNTNTALTWMLAFVYVHGERVMHISVYAAFSTVKARRFRVRAVTNRLHMKESCIMFVYENFFGFAILLSTALNSKL